MPVIMANLPALISVIRAAIHILLEVEIKNPHAFGAISFTLDRRSRTW
jgi:hypothetical protein